tara:strand:- start:706 stop:1338 length:633 start_codon:yes stop_codon:yes gene_type:complete
MLWLNYVFNKNDKILINMPFNGQEFGNLILEEKGLNNVLIEETSVGDHYDLNEKKVKILNDRLNKKSLTSISIICHEIGHAIQHQENYKPLKNRTIIVKSTAWITQIGNSILLIGIPFIFATGATSLIKTSLIIVLISLIIGVFIHIITLDVEFDASFNRAMPIIKEKIPKEYHNACRSVLLAAAFTYVVGTIRNFISLRYIWLLLSRIR